MSAEIALFLRGDQLVVIPLGGGGGYFFHIEPVRVVPAEDVAAANAAVRDALADSAACPLSEPPAEEGRGKSPALAAVKVRSWKAFYRGASHCSVYEEDGQLYLEQWVPAADGRGFEPSDDPPVPIDRDHAGERALEYLRRAPRMP